MVILFPGIVLHFLGLLHIFRLGIVLKFYYQSYSYINILLGYFMFPIYLVILCSGIVLNILLGYLAQVQFWTFYLVILCSGIVLNILLGLLHILCPGIVLNVLLVYRLLRYLNIFTWLFCAQVLFWTFYLVILCSGIVLNILLGYFVLMYSFEQLGYFVSRYCFEHFTWLFCAHV